MVALSKSSSTPKPELYDFQQEDVDYLRGRKSVLIANEMGTGKTFEAFARDVELRADSTWERKATLYVAPLSTLSVIADTARNFNLSVVTCDSKARMKSW